MHDVHVSNKSCKTFLKCFGFWPYLWLCPHPRYRQTDISATLQVKTIKKGTLQLLLTRISMKIMKIHLHSNKFLPDNLRMFAPKISEFMRAPSDGTYLYLCFWICAHFDAFLHVLCAVSSPISTHFGSPTHP